jgi:gluconate 2-dehydrogenase gamma chain
MSRLSLLKRTAGVAGAAAAGGVLAAGEAHAMPVAAEASPPPLRFFTQWEFDYVTAMAETIWPTDDLGPGAREGGVGNYIDGQLAGSWGQGHRFYLNGPFLQAQTSGHGWQVPMTPAEVYRAFLPGFDAYTKTTYGRPYTALPAAQQAQALTSADFFSMFRQNVLEGMLADPAYGGNREMVGWKWLRFPGDPMRRGDIYEQYIFTRKPYPFEKKPLPLMASSLKAAAKGAAAPAEITKTASSKGGM